MITAGLGEKTESPGAEAKYDARPITMHYGMTEQKTPQHLREELRW
jgi:hypothetical protein